MAFRTENALLCAPGMILSELEGGGMIFDRNSGEYLPAEQVLLDPLRISQLDILEQDHLGCLKLALCDDVPDDGEVSALQGDDEEGDGFDGTNPDSTRSFASDEEELTRLIAEHLDDFGDANVIRGNGGHPVLGSCKASHPDLGNDKLDNDRLYRYNSHGPRGRQVYKDRRLRQEGSGKTRPKIMV